MRWMRQWRPMTGTSTQTRCGAIAMKVQDCTPGQIGEHSDALSWQPGGQDVWNALT